MITVKRGLLYEIGGFLPHTRALVVTDSGVPREYAEAVCACCEATLLTLPQGEESKNTDSLQRLLSALLHGGFHREDAVIAVGGGMVCDIAGLAASLYERGMKLYLVPTTVLAQVDASIGGKNAVNFGSVKNLIGTFYEPTAVLIDPDLTVTLPSRERASGLAEAIKMGVTLDEKLLQAVEENDYETVVTRSVAAKSRIVSLDKTDRSIRRVLNFGHTVGHALEATRFLPHGECVALGMLCMSSEEVRARLLPLYQTLGLPCTVMFDPSAVKEKITQDKKATADGILVTLADKIGVYHEECLSADAILSRLAVIKEQL